MRTFLVGILVVVTSSCFQPVGEGDDGGLGGGGGAVTGGGAGGGLGGGAGGGLGGGAGGGLGGGSGGGLGGGAGGGLGGGAGGGLGGGSGGGTAVDAGPTMFGVVRADCAPNDGPAWHFVLTDTPVGCEVLNDSEGYFIDLWVDPLVPGTTYELTPGGNRQGSACLCGLFENGATEGKVRIDAVSPVGMSGHIDATFVLGTVRHDTFNVIVCPGQRLCG
jgi:hypothetical protein